MMGAAIGAQPAPLTLAEISAVDRSRAVSQVMAVVDMVAVATDVSVAELLSPTRGRGHVADARALICYAASRRGLSHTEIGKALGRDHTTVAKGIARIAARIDRDAVPHDPAPPMAPLMFRSRRALAGGAHDAA